MKNINELFGSMMIQAVSMFMKHNISKSYINLDFGTKFIKPKLNEQQKKAHDSLESKEDKYNYLLSLIPNLNNDDLSSVIYILVAKNKIKNFRQSIAKCNVIINCNLEALKRMIERELKKISDQTQSSESSSSVSNANESMELEDGTTQAPEPQTKMSYIEKLINGNDNFRFKESDDLHISNIQKYYQNSLIIQQYLQTSTNSQKITLEQQNDFSDLIDSNDIFEKDIDTKTKNEMRKKKLQSLIKRSKQR